MLKVQQLNSNTVPLSPVNDIEDTSYGDYSNRYMEATQETLVGLYAQRDPVTGRPTEDINGIIDRVATSVAIAELKYKFSVEELVSMSLEDALRNKEVQGYRKVFSDHIGNQKFWANTPANINACPEVSLNVLKYWANGRLAEMEEDKIWLRSEEFRKAYINKNTKHLSHEQVEMGRIANELRGKGCLAACGVTYVEDSLEGIQEAARIEALAAKAAMENGVKYLNTQTVVFYYF